MVYILTHLLHKTCHESRTRLQAPAPQVIEVYDHKGEQLLCSLVTLQRFSSSVGRCVMKGRRLQAHSYVTHTAHAQTQDVHFRCLEDAFFWPIEDRDSLGNRCSGEVGIGWGGVRKDTEGVRWATRKARTWNKDRKKKVGMPESAVCCCKEQTHRDLLL